MHSVLYNSTGAERLSGTSSAEKLSRSYLGAVPDKYASVPTANLGPVDTLPAIGLCMVVVVDAFKWMPTAEVLIVPLGLITCPWEC